MNILTYLFIRIKNYLLNIDTMVFFVYISILSYSMRRVK